MSNGLIVRLLPLGASAYSSPGGYWGVSSTFPVANLADPQPKVVTQSPAPGSAGLIGLVIDVDLGADTAIDTLAVMFTNLSTNAIWQAHAWTSAAGRPALGSEVPADLLFGQSFGAFGVAPTTRENRRHGFARGASVNRRYVRIYLQDTTAQNSEQVVRVGIVAIGQAIAPTFNFELGSGRAIDDQSTVRTLPGGETYVERGARVPRWRATWSNLSEAEYRQLWSLLTEVGTGAPILAIEDPDAVTGQAEAMHYGLIEAIDFTERVQVEKQRIELRVMEML